MYWGCSGDLGHHPCKVSDPHPLSFISIVCKNYAKSAEKANFALLRCGKWALWKNWSIDIGLMYWGCSGDLGHHPCKVSDAHPLSFISIVGKKCWKSKFCHITVRQMGAVEKPVHRYWVDVLGVLKGPRASSLQSFRSSSSFLHIDSWPKLCKKCWKSKFCHITVRQMGAVEKLVHRYWVDVLGVLRGPRASSLQSFRCSSSSLHIDSWQKVLKKQILPYYGAANGRCEKNWSIDIGLMYWGCSGDLGHHPCKVSEAHPLSFISIVGKKCWKSKFCHITVWQMGAVEKLVHRYWVDVLGVLKGPRASSLQSFRSSSSFLHIDSWPKLCKKCWKSKFCHITVRQMGVVEKLVHRYWVDVLGVLRGPRASSLQSFRSSSSFLHIDSWQKLCKKCWKSKFCHITVRQMGAVEKLVHRYWVDVLGVLRGPRASSLQSFRCSSSFLHIDSWQKVLKKQILPYYGEANGRCGKTGP